LTAIHNGTILVCFKCFVTRLKSVLYQTMTALMVRYISFQYPDNSYLHQSIILMT